MGPGGIIFSYCMLGALILGCILGTVFEFIMLFSNGLQILPLIGSLISLVGICTVMTRDRMRGYNFEIYSESFKLSLIFGTIQFLLYLPIKFDDDDRILLAFYVAFFGQVAKCFIGYAISSIFEEELNGKIEKYRKYLLSYYQEQLDALTDALTLIKESTQAVNSSEKLVNLFEKCGYKKLRKAFCESDNKRNNVLIGTLKQSLVGVGLYLVRDDMTVAQIRQEIVANIPQVQEKTYYYYGKDHIDKIDFRKIKAEYETIRGTGKVKSFLRSFGENRRWLPVLLVAVLLVGGTGTFLKLENIYHEALIQQADGHYVAANYLLESIRWYKDAESLIMNQKYEVEHEQVTTANIGDVVTFGECNDATLEVNGAIEWVVLAKENGKVLLLSNDVLTHEPYNRKTSDVTWEDSSIRKWLNTTFYTSAFNNKEQQWICETITENSDNTIYKTSAGNDTIDRIFLLSNYEANKLLSSKSASSWWWLRSPGMKNNCAARISADGKFLSRGEYALQNGGVRPAMWVR